MNIVTLLITQSYLLSSKEEKHVWFESHLYRNQREYQWRCIQKECNGRFKTVKNSKGEEEIFVDRNSHNCSPITYEDFMCKKALTRMKERIKAELHTSPCTYTYNPYTQELDNIVAVGKIPRSIVGSYIKSFQYYKNTFMKLRKRLKPAILHDL